MTLSRGVGADADATEAVYWIADLPAGAQPLRVEARAGRGVLASAPGRPGR